MEMESHAIHDRNAGFILWLVQVPSDYDHHGSIQILLDVHL
jgi:hypothetical protein